MGTTHVYAGMVANAGPLNLERCEYVGLQKTYSHNSDVTDSGASGTALATGVKTNNGSIGVDPDGKPVKSILEYAEENGFSTGLLATCAITQATPASFSAHNRKRGKYEDIAYDICRSGADMSPDSSFVVLCGYKDYNPADYSHSTALRFDYPSCINLQSEGIAVYSPERVFISSERTEFPAALHRIDLRLYMK